MPEVNSQETPEDVISHKIGELLKEAPIHGSVTVQVVFREKKACRIVTNREESLQIPNNDCN